MVAPYFQNGLELVPTGKLVSRPYLEMTIRLMRYFGAAVAWQGESIVVQPGQYTPRTFRVEADWSAASYWYAMAAFANDVDLTLHGLSADSLQGDAVLAKMFEKFGITSTFGDNQVHLRKNGQPPRPIFEQDFVECPDIAQTLAVVCAGLGVQGLFTGLETLSIKETDRIAAIRTELKKVHATFVKLPPHFSKKQPDKTFYLVDDKARWEAPPRFATYGDHRMAMAFAPLAFLGNIEIEKPEVVEKSYPRFWEDLQTVGFQIS
jgi:3-phosphoshikimate 1-carboxyvinyltransferase